MHIFYEENNCSLGHFIVNDSLSNCSFCNLSRESINEKAILID